MIYSLSNSLARASLNLGGFKLSGAARRIQLCRSKWQYGRLSVAKSAGDSTESLSFEVGGSNKLDGDIRKVTHQRGEHMHPKRELARARQVCKAHPSVWLFSMPAHTQPNKLLPVPFVLSLLHLAICCTMHSISQLLYFVFREYWDSKTLTLTFK